MSFRRAQAAIKSPPAPTRRLRGQAAMEFLMTYGWAVLILVVVIAILFYLGVFSPGDSAVKSCVFPSGFTCTEFDVDSSGSLFLDLGQGTGKMITVTGIGCSVNSSPAISNSPGVVIRSGAHAWLNMNSNGTPCYGASGEAFKGSVILSYSVAGSSLPRTVTGTVSAPMRGSVSGGGSGGSGADVWILVPGNPSLGTSDFWVMKYEAKNNGSGTAVSTAAGTPWISVTQPNAQAACALAGGHLLTLPEAQTINLNLASQPSNWLGGVVGTGCLYVGHTQCTYGGNCSSAMNASTSDAEGWWNGTVDARNASLQNCPPTSNSQWGNETRRTMYLSNGAIIWDWAGNVQEWLNDTCTTAQWYNSGAFIEWNNSNLDDYERAALGPPGSTWSYTRAVGRYYGCTVDGNGYSRGGVWWWGGSGSAPGIFKLEMNMAPTDAYLARGFRCAR